MSNYLLTPSLLSAWHWYLGNTDGEGEREKFLSTLRREPFIPNEAMQAGIDFENDVTAFLQGKAVEGDPTNEYVSCVQEVAETIRGASLQVKAKRLMVLPSRTFLMYGRLDALKADTIYDIKYTGSEYEIGKYQTSPQHKLYFYIVPEVSRFIYLISNGKLVWQEEYRQEDCPSIQEEAADFVTWLETFPEFKVIYDAKWVSF